MKKMSDAEAEGGQARENSSGAVIAGELSMIKGKNDPNKTRHQKY